MTDVVRPQKDPIANKRKPVWPLVIRDMLDRDSFGEEKYDTRLQPFNGRDTLTDIYQELLDACVYIRCEMMEREAITESLVYVLALLEKGDFNKAMHEIQKIIELMGAKV